jgi:hypothetical protein
VSDSPIDQVLGAADKLDVEGLVSLLAPDGRILVADGRRAEGTEAARRLFEEFIGKLRHTSHRVTARWHIDDVWIAEFDAEYELHDYLKLGPLPRAMILRDGPHGITDLRFYGAHERSVDDHRTGEEGLWIGGRWVPPL